MKSSETLEEIQTDDETLGLSCALELFSEHAEVLSMIDNLKTVVNSPQCVKEKAYERFNYILSQYHEQPHLIDSHLDVILDRCVGIVRNGENSMELKHETFKYMYVVINVRGYKVVVRHLPHEVSDFEPVLQLLECQDVSDAETWTTRYVLVLWLSIIIFIPFHLSKFDGFNAEKTVMERVLDICKKYAVVSDSCRYAAAFLVSNFLTRIDVKEHLPGFLEWACTESAKDDVDIFVKYGTLACVAMILKHGKREDLLPHVRNLLQWVINAEFKNSVEANVQKLVYKIIQRIGMTFLPPRMVAWRYQRGNRSLTANLSAGDSKKLTNEATKQVDNVEEEEFDVPDEVEEVIDQLIQGLGCADSIVRWSAAKGVGRITGRLPKELADEVVGSVLEIFSRRDSDSAWHGGCLALAELGRRGLLLPQRLPEVVPVVLKALVYDEPRGYASVGSHIRDAACYACWSFARAYETHILAPYVQEIASTLVVMTCFDREINCRRAASAAFQENVGRQGTFPHGIEILVAADFYTVSVRKNAYLNVSTYIAQFSEYTKPLIEHLITRKIDHWDCSIRELTAKALYNLTPLAADFMIETVLPELFAKCKTIDLNARHGAVLAIGEIFKALAAENKTNSIGDELFAECKNLIGFFQERLYFRGLGGELMRQACSSFIQNCSVAKVPFHNNWDVIDIWFSLLNDCISYDVAHIRSAALAALPSFFDEYYKGTDENIVNKRLKIIGNYLKAVKMVNTEVVRMGHALALGTLPPFMLQDDLNGILEALIGVTYITPETLKWAESRRDAAKALTAICVCLDCDVKTVLTDDMLTKIYESFLNGLKEYTLDNRGDIGAWMREASMSGLETLTLLLRTNKPEFLTPNLVAKIITGIGQQAVEKIDRTRALAGKIFYNLIHSEPNVPNIPNHVEIKNILERSECDTLNWNSEADTFPKFVQLLQFPTYTYNILLGLICSVGGMTETLVKNSSSALFSYLHTEHEKKGPSEIVRLCDVIYSIFWDHQKIDRVVVPIFRFLDKLMSSGCISCVINDKTSEFPKKILKLIQAELITKDIYKLIDGINVLCQFIQINSDVAKTALVQLSIVLCHRQAYVRRSTSAMLYESLLLYGDSGVIPMDTLDEAMELLSVTNWDEPVDVVKPTRNKICTLLGISVPVPKKKT